MDRICRVCGSPRLELVVDFGRFPVGHHLRKARHDPDPRFPLNFHACRNCGLLQVVEPIDPDLLYADADSYSTAFQRPAHLADLIITMLARKMPGPVLEVGCNDGYFLKLLRERGFDRLVGIEPNRIVSELGRRDGLEIINGFFSPDSLADLKARNGGGFDFIVSRHVLEHVEAVEAFLAAVREGLTPGGLFVLELPHVEAGIDCGNPTILWEEHVNYFGEPLLKGLLRAAGFRILDTRFYAFGGGTIALIAERDQASPPVSFATADWSSAAPAPDYYPAFARRVADYRRSLRNLVAAYRAAGWRIALYGAAPRSCTVVNFCGLGDAIDMVVDDRAEIQARFLPGTDRAVAGLDAVDPEGGPVLFLMGVGSENEHKVAARIAARTGTRPRMVSLFPPRDSLASFAAASSALATSSER